jgi:hypothetical protein
MYGLKQLPMHGMKPLIHDTWMVTKGLIRSKHDPNLCILVKFGKQIIILLYVDNVLITGNNEIEIKKI